MRNFTLLSLLVLSALTVKGQDIAVTFSGTVSSVMIDSVTATNLATGQIITLPGDATLLLTPKTGVSTSPMEVGFSLVYPNPFSGQTNILVSVSEPQEVNLTIRDLSGRSVARTRAFLEPGEHGFTLVLSTPGIYFTFLENATGTSAQKVICTTGGSGNHLLHRGSATQSPPRKAISTAYTLGYSAGETIQYRCCCSDFRAVFTDSPMEPVHYKVAFPPIAAFSIDSGEGTIYDRIVLDASACTDAETPADELEVRWDLDGDGIWDTEYDQSKSMFCQYSHIGSYTLRLEVKDLGGLTDSVSVSVNITYPSFTDSRDENVYQYKRIGDQVWMVENLAYLPAVNPSNTGSATSKHHYVYGYEGSDPGEAKETENYDTYGALYNWEAAKQACPSGWHLPSEEEWQTLEKYLGMTESDLIAFRERVSGDVGKKLKSTSGWDNNGNGDNSTGFNALPAGTRWRDYGFVYRGELATFWSSSERAEDTAFCRYLSITDGVQRWSDFRFEGFSVRCLKD